MRGERPGAEAALPDDWREGAAEAARGWLAWILGDHLKDLMGANPLPLPGNEGDITATEPIREEGGRA